MAEAAWLSSWRKASELVRMRDLRRSRTLTSIAEGHQASPSLHTSRYISILKRLRGEYLKEDAETTLSDKSFAQRLLVRAGLTRKERMDIFFSSGNQYNSSRIEKVIALSLFQHPCG